MSNCVSLILRGDTLSAGLRIGYTTAGMDSYWDELSYDKALRKEAALPRGFRVGTTTLEFTPAERPTREPYRMDLGCILLDEPTPAFAGVFTRNAVTGAPVRIGRRRLSEPVVRGILVNNKISNVCAEHGEHDAEELLARFFEAGGIPPEQVFPVSTGIIGWALPVPEMAAATPRLVEGLHREDAVDLARAIMTTDGFPKARSALCGEGRILAVAKGAGMIEPNMATMLVFILTDVAVSREVLRRVLPTVCDETFNRITIDGDQSTSDMALAISSGQVEAPSEEEVADELRGVCALLAEDIVRNGEGTSHVIECTVDEARTTAEAVGIGKAVVNSPLVKTAIYGNDPNVGRIVMAIGDYAGQAGIPLDTAHLTIEVGEVPVFVGGAFRLDREKEIRLSSYLQTTAMNPRLHGYPQHDRKVSLRIRCGLGSAHAAVLGSDLSHEYVHENADYRS